MWPLVREYVVSRSFGVITCLLRMSDFRFGAYSDSVLTTVSPSASALASQSPLLRRNGANCMTIDMTCVPGGASEESETDGMVMSRYGRFEKLPYLESSKARSRKSISGAMWMRPDRAAAPSGPPVGDPFRAVNSGRPERARFTFATLP